jgi:uncharacterized protein (DUF433 family)
MDNYLISDLTIRGGEICLHGTRLTVNDVISIVDNGELDNYDYISAAQITACRAYVARAKATNCHNLANPLAQ